MNAIADEDPDGPNAVRPVDVFLLYNEREKRADWVADRLREAGLTIHFFRSDIAVGEPFRDKEQDRIRRAGSVVVLLGASGWGATQLELLALAMEQSKRLLPVLVGKVSKNDLDAGKGLFRDRLYVDLSSDDPEAMRKLVDAIRGAETPSPRDSLRFDDLIGTLVDGNDAERAALLDQLINRGFVNASALAERLRQRIRTDFAPDQERRSSAAVRAPERLPAIRSWMLSTVIWLDADHPDTRELVLSHINSNYETDRFVRFWCLAGLIQRKVSYLDAAPLLARLRRRAPLGGNREGPRGARHSCFGTGIPPFRRARRGVAPPSGALLLRHRGYSAVRRARRRRRGSHGQAAVHPVTAVKSAAPSRSPPARLSLVRCQAHSPKSA